MAQPQGRPTRDVGFNNIELFKDQALGIGSYGAVCKAKCDDLLCAAKILHPTLFDPTAHKRIVHHREHRLPFSRFQQECEFMSAIRHPNIVQYLGTCQDPETHLPVLLMELMDDSLTHFLEGSQEPLPYHTQLNFCHDIAQALSFLHSNAIIHRDLSSNNVLLIGDARAKVTDFGMAKLGDINPQATRISFTMCPGTDAYMPPEAVKENPVHTVKIDSFSFGVLVVQILTRQFPKPGDRLKTVHTTDPRFPTIQIPASEIERRQSNISQVDPNNPFRSIALDCLKDEEMDRPSAQELCTRIVALKESPQYIESVRIAREKTTSDQDGRTEREEQIREQLQQRNETIAAKQKEIQQLRQHHFHQNVIIEAKERVIQQLKQQYSLKVRGLQCERSEITEQLLQQNEILAAKEREIQQLSQEHSQQIQGLQQLLESHNNCLQEKEQKILAEQLENEQLQQRLVLTVRQNNQVVREKDAIIQEKERQIQKQLETTEQVMSQFQTRIQDLETQLSRRDHQSSSDSAEVVAEPQQTPNNHTQTHGSGASARVVYKKSIKLSWREGKKAPCKTFRSADAVVSGNMVYLLQSNTRHIHTYNSTEDTWSQLPDCLMEYCTLAVVNKNLTTIGGQQGSSDTNQLFSLTEESYQIRFHRKWTEVLPPMPTKRSNAVAVCGETALIVAGGNSGKHILTVEVLNTDTRQWSTAADLPGPLCHASATICGDHIYMLGGWSDIDTPTKSVYTCSVSSLLQSFQNKSLVAGLKTSPSSAEHVWSEAAELPVTMSTCVTLHGRLLAIGGGDSDLNPTTAVYMYNSTTNTWEVVSRMKIGRRLCLAAVLPNKKLMVVGGRNTSRYESKTDYVEIATVV